MTGRRVAATLIVSSLVAGAGCGSDTLSALQGEVLVSLINAQASADQVFVAILTEEELLQASEPITRPETLVEIEAVPVGVWDVTVRTLSADGATLRSVKVKSVIIEANEVTEIVIDLGEEIIVELPCDPTSDTDWPLCTICESDGMLVPVDDDDRCGVVDCSVYESWALSGDNTATGESACTNTQKGDVITGRCADPGVCLEASVANCPTVGTVVTNAGVCERIDGCVEGTPALYDYPTGTPCGTDLECDGAGNCVPITGPEIGCADGEREGFLDLPTYPSIAGCSGAWAVGGVTRTDLAPTCGRGSGDDGGNLNGDGCAAVDLCAAGWHVCLGKDEVASKAGSCDDAVPPGTPDKGLLFAVSQNSTNNSICDASTNSNDVFGCGNLGTELMADKECAPLNRALASMAPNSCGFNEAEPTLGPWVCQGAADSHLMEGSLVTKDGCPDTSCEYSGSPVGSSDKGGVLCCRD